MKKLKYFFGYYKKHKKLFVLDFGCALFMSILDLIFPIFTQRIVDGVLPTGNAGILMKFCIFLICLQVVRNILGYIQKTHNRHNLYCGIDYTKHKTCITFFSRLGVTAIAGRVIKKLDKLISGS